MSEHIATDAEIAEIERLAKAALPSTASTQLRSAVMLTRDEAVFACHTDSVLALIARIRVMQETTKAHLEIIEDERQRAEAAEALTQKWIEKSRDSDTQAFSNWNRAEAAEAKLTAVRELVDQWKFDADSFDCAALLIEVLEPVK